MRRWLLRVTRQGMPLAVPFLFFCLSGAAYSRQTDEPRAKAWLGVTVRDVTEEAAKANKLEAQKGALVAEVADNGPADSAGIREKDIIVGFGQKEINDANDLVQTVSKAKVGDKISVRLVREGEKQTLQVALGAFPHHRALGMNSLFKHFRILRNGANEGMQLMELNDQLAEYFGTQDGVGLLVVKVKKGSAAEKAGIKAGDVLTKIGNRTIDDVEDVSKALAKYNEGGKVDVEVLRKGTSKTLSLQVSQDNDDYSYDFDNEWGRDDMFQMPPFQEFRYEIPHFDEHDFQFNVHPRIPDMKDLEHKLQNLQKSLKQKQRTMMIKVHDLDAQGV